jgi:hypothetical protein
MTAAEFVSPLKGVTKTRNGYECCCPNHDDHRRSLCVADGDKGVLLDCKAGCKTEAVCAARGVKIADLFYSKPQRNGGRDIEATYPYEDEASKVLFEVVRLHPKDFRQRRPDGKGGWIWDMKGVRRAPFRLPQLVVAVKAGRPVYVAEGEKDVLALEAAGFAATTNPGGAGKWLPEYGRYLAGAAVVVVADKDGPGRNHAQDVAAKLYGIASSVKVIELPDLAGRPVKDAADYFADGGTAADLDALAEAAPPWTPAAHAAPRTEYIPSGDEAGADGRAATPPPVARPLSALVRPVDGDDPAELLRYRYLCRGGGLLLCGPTGVGKSALAIQAAILWALCRECLGIVPARLLKSLIVQAEDDDGDMAEMRDGVIRGLGLSEADVATACARVLVVTEDTRTGAALCRDVLRPLLAEHRPDLLWLNPALAYLGGEASAQRDVGGFLRNGLNPLLHEYDCGGIPIHHTNKPPTGREKPDWRAGDYAYLGAGSAEWANWARAVLAVRSIGSHDVYELRAGKRGGRLRWREPDGSAGYVRYLAHATEPGVICWRDVDPEDVDRGGRPKNYDPAELLALLPAEGLTTGEWVKLAKDECGVSEATLHRERRAFVKAGKVLKSTTSRKWQPVKKR